MHSRNLLTTFILSAGLAVSAPSLAADVIGEVELLSRSGHTEHRPMNRAVICARVQVSMLRN